MPYAVPVAAEAPRAAIRGDAGGVEGSSAQKLQVNCGEAQACEQHVFRWTLHSLFKAWFDASDGVACGTVTGPAQRWS